jgi:Tetratricopeptide Repeats-Sensor
MPRAFVVRPFGTKKDSSGKQIDFDRVHEELIRPALEANDIAGGTTGEIVDSGNIRDDMFQLILEADIVVCDITVHNANVFYELGIRHALRKKRTVLIQGGPTADKTPFDLLTDRYFPYDADTPATRKDALAQAISATMRSDRPTDSPIFQMLPALPEADPEEVQVVPPDLREEIRRAAAASASGWLRLLADEIMGQRFERSGLKLVAEAQLAAKDYEGARNSWERIRDEYPQDVAANLALANIYERQSRAGRDDLLEKSDQALERVLGSSKERSDVAEALALKGRNEKTHWRRGLGKAASLQQRRQAALNPSLRRSYESYLGAFLDDLNHFYSGLAALQMGSILLDLCGEDGWKDAFDEDNEAETYRLALMERLNALKHVVPLSVKAALRKLDENHRDYVWARISEADVLFLTSDKDARVLKAYEDALSTGSEFAWDAAKGQLELFADLGVRADRARAIIERVEQGMTRTEPSRETSRPTHVVVFAGHQVDEPGRPERRFPAGREAEARALVKAAMKRVVDDQHDFVGLASASPGADILWHEVCQELGLKSVMCLPMPKEDHARAVFKDHDDWRSRFLDLVAEKNGQVLTLSDRPGLPKWLGTNGVDPWERGNKWVMKLALTWGADKVTLLALWDGRERGVGTGGTAQVVQLARDAGNVRIERIDSTQLAA